MEKTIIHWRPNRKEVFMVAVKYFLKKLKLKEILNALNEAYSETEPPEEATLREKSKTYYSKKIWKKN